MVKKNAKYCQICQSYVAAQIGNGYCQKVNGGLRYFIGGSLSEKSVTECDQWVRKIFTRSSLPKIIFALKGKANSSESKYRYAMRIAETFTLYKLLIH